MPDPSLLATFAIAGTATAGVILRPFGWREAIFAVAGALALVLGGLVDPPAAMAAIARGTEVYLFLAGMMVLAELARREQVFDWTAVHAARLARGSGVRLFDLVFLTGVIVTALLSNDATAVVLTPAVCAAARAAKANPLPALYACAFVANAASFILPISNPANLVLFGAHIPTLGAWLAWFGVPSLIAVGLTWALLRWRFRAVLAQPISAEAPRPALPLSGRIAAGGIAIACAVLLVASALGLRLGLATFIVGVLTSVLALAASRRSPVPLLSGVSWSVIPLVAGLFVLVAGLEATGFVDALARLLGGYAAVAPQATGFGAGALLALVCNLMNNLPAGLLAASAAAAGAVPPAVTGALLVGVDLGPNLSVTGSLATILWLIAIRREGEHVSAWDFLKLGTLVTIPALVPALAAVVWLAP
ncbi:MAG: arsenic transporter [Hyphomicrobiales bacterium]|nr:arsenic transporter [Hyphomicrobiales bacterium]